jgi:hypothetical protein
MIPYITSFLSARFQNSGFVTLRDESIAILGFITPANAIAEARISARTSSAVSRWPMTWLPSSSSTTTTRAFVHLAARAGAYIWFGASGISGPLRDVPNLKEEARRDTDPLTKSIWFLWDGDELNRMVLLPRHITT